MSNGTKPISSKWWGKLSTVMIFVTMVYAIVIDVYTVPVFLLYILIFASVVCMGISVAGYFRMFSGQVKGVKAK
jgi:hypothetical protein